jgi:hypothetical protein
MVGRFSKFVQAKWRLPAAEPLLAELQTLLGLIDGDLEEGCCKRLATENQPGGARPPSEPPLTSAAGWLPSHAGKR